MFLRSFSEDPGLRLLRFGGGNPSVGQIWYGEDVPCSDA